MVQGICSIYRVMLRAISAAAVLLLFSSKSWANVVGADTQNFNPTPSGLDFVTVHSSETLEPGIVNFGLYLNYAVNSLPNYEDINNQNRVSFKDQLTSSDFNIGVGLGPNWDAGVSFPQVLAQSVDNDAARGQFEDAGMTEIRAMTKYRLWGNAEGGLAAVASMNFNQIQDNPFVGEDAGPTTNLELAYDMTLGKTALGFNLGYRFRDPGDAIPGVPVEPFDDQIIMSAAVSHLVTDWDTKLIGEVFGSLPTESTDFGSDRDVSSAELLVGLKYDVRTDIAFHVGGGTELIRGTASPSWRVYTGLNWTLGPVWSKSRAIVRSKDVFQQAQGDPFAGTPEDEERFVGKDILFAFDSDVVLPQFEQLLARLADYAKKPPGFKRLIVEGHTDSVGRAEYNRDLSERRAKSVVEVLSSKMGLPPNKVEYQGLGEARPIADNGNYQGRAANRRVEFKIIRK